MNSRTLAACATLLLFAGAATAQAQFAPAGYGYTPTHPAAYGQGSPQMFGLQPGMPMMGPGGLPPHAMLPETPFQQASFGGKKKAGNAGGCGGCATGACHGACGSCCGVCDDCCGTCEPECPQDIPYVPNMLGDSLGIPRVSNNGLSFPRHFNKVADNNAVRPATRLSLGYNLFGEVPTTVNPGTGQVLNRRELQEMKLVGEAAFLDGRASFQLIVPLYHTVELYQPDGTNLNDRLDFELGRVAAGIKGLLIETDAWCVSAGCLVETPTMEDIRLGNLRVREDSLYVTPWVGCEVTPNDTFFAQGFASYRFNTRDNPALFSNAPTGDFAREQDMLMLDLQLGAWLWRNPCEGRVMGIAPTVELHYTTTLEDDTSPPTTVTSVLYGRVDQLNLTGAMNFEFGNASTLAVGCAVPLREKVFPGGDLRTDAMFDWELIVQFNQYW